MKAVIPVAGQGTRLYPIGIDTPKCLLKIHNKPIIEWTLNALRDNGVADVVLVVGVDDFAQEIRNFFVDNQERFQGMNISFAEQAEKLGTANALQCAAGFFAENEQLIFLNGDDLYGPKNIASLVNAESSVIIGFKVKDPEKYGVLLANESGNLQKVVEKPQEFVTDLANINCFRVDARIFDLYEKLEKSPRGELEITDSLTLFANEFGLKVLESQDYWLPVGYPWHILDATEHLAHLISPDIQGEVEPNVQIKGNLVLPATSRIKSGSYIEGNVIIGENCVIGPNAYIRGTTVLGDNSRISFGSEVKNSVIGVGSVVAHLCYVGDSVVGDDVNIAGTSSTANLRHDNGNVKTLVKGQLTDTGRRKFGAVIGSGARLGIGTKIYPGRKIWPKMTTLPGEVVKNDLL